MERKSAMKAALVGAGLAASMVLGTAHAGMPDRIVVKYRETGLVERSGAARETLRDAGSRMGVSLVPVRRAATGGNVIRVEGDLSRADLARLITQIAADPSVEYVHEDRVMRHLLTPTDSRYNEQWHYFEATASVKANTAWDTTNGAGVVVAVLDTGYRPHADLTANILQGYDFISDASVGNDGNGRDTDASDPGDWVEANNANCGDGTFYGSSWHGTHVAGTIAAVTNNATGVAGVAYGARVVPARVLGTCGGYTTDIADAIIWASGGSVSGVPANANPARVINLSLGGGGACDATTQAAINSARSRNTTVIVAAGNENQNASNSSPANCSGVVTVAAVNRSGGRAYYSNYGAVVDVAGPGGAQSSANDPNGVLSTVNTGTRQPVGDGYAFFQGTSMATPHVAAVAALLYAQKPASTPDQIEAALKGSARAFPATCSQCGTGIVDAPAAIAAINGGGGGTGPVVLANGVAATGLTAATGAKLYFTLTVPAGATGLKFEMSGGTGDADMYVKFGSAPTTSSYDCRPYLGGNTETCNIATAQAGTYHVMLNAYAGFSGVSLKGSFTTGGGGGSCATGFTHYTGTIAAGASVYVPGTGGYVSSVSGTHSGRLTGPAGTDFDLYLHKKNGSNWSQVKASEGSTSTESPDYSGTSGTYRWRIYAYSGSGTYNLCIKKP